MRIPSVLSSSRGRFFLSIGIVIFAVYGVIAAQAYIHIGYYLDLRRTELRRIVDVGVTSMRPVIEEYQAGDIGYIQARRRIVQNIRGLSYQEDGFPNFFFVGTYEMAPITSTSEFYGSGTQPVEAYRLLSFEVLQELAALARSEQGRGFITYEADSADGSSQRKIAYIRGIPELGIYIGTRLSTSDINQAISEVVIRSVLIGTCLVLLTAFFLVLALRPLARLTRILSQVFTRIADDPNESLQAVNTQPLPWAEGEAIFNGLQRMLTSLRTARFRQEESEDRFRRLFSESRDAILLTNGLQILECNQRAEGFLQMRRDVLIGSDIRDVLLRSPSLSDSELIELLERAIDGETVEIALELPENGEALVRRYADVSIYPQYLDMEFGFQVVMHDITTIRQTEQMLQNLSENLYRTLYSIGDGIIATDADGSITRMNKVAEDLTGWTQHGAVGLSLNEVVQLRDIATGSSVACSLNEVLQTGCNSRTETREMVTPAGIRRTVSENGAPIRAADDSITGGVVVFRDVTSQIQMQRELRENQRILSLVLDHVPVGVGAFSRRGEFVYANPVLCEMLGYSAIELRRLRFDKMIYPDDLHLQAESFERLMHGAGHEAFEIRYIQRSGEVRSAILRGGRVDSEEQHDRPDFMVAIFQDITEMKRAEQEAKKQEQLLIQAEKLAALGELSAGMAHEINQPLTGISMAADNLQFLASGQIPGKQLNAAYVQEKTDHMHSYIDRIRSIIEHVRTFSREQLQEHRSPFSVQTAVQNALSLISSQYRGNGIELVSEYQETPMVVGNLYRLEQVILNLLTNARDAVNDRAAKNEDGYRPQIAINITAGYTSDNFKSACITISDNGIGIPDDQQQQVFNPFYTTKPVDKGTGLGLSVAYGIVQEMGGTIELDSRPGYGTTVTVCIPSLEE